MNDALLIHLAHMDQHVDVPQFGLILKSSGPRLNGSMKAK